MDSLINRFRTQTPNTTNIPSSPTDPNDIDTDGSNGNDGRRNYADNKYINQNNETTAYYHNLLLKENAEAAKDFDELQSKVFYDDFAYTEIAVDEIRKICRKKKDSDINKIGNWDLTRSPQNTLQYLYELCKLDDSRKRRRSDISELSDNNEIDDIDNELYEIENDIEENKQNEDQTIELNNSMVSTSRGKKEHHDIRQSK